MNVILFLFFVVCLNSFVTFWTIECFIVVLNGGHGDSFADGADTVGKFIPFSHHGVHFTEQFHAL